MRATFNERLLSDPDWLFEPKLDGIRALALIDRGQVRLLSRRELEMTTQYPTLAAQLARQPTYQLAFDAEGRPSFERLQERLHLTRPEDMRNAELPCAVHYYVFDCLCLGGFELCSVPPVAADAVLERAPSLPSDLDSVLEQLH